MRTRCTARTLTPCLPNFFSAGQQSGYHIEIIGAPLRIKLRTPMSLKFQYYFRAESRYLACAADDWLPKQRILYPWPHDRFAVKHPRWEPYAGIPPVRICAKGARK
jgi:hypothetical protein